jgi:alcohol dehydrogenase (cytochrome c)
MENVTAAIRALDPLTGDLRWEYPITPSVSFGAGILTTAGGVLFSGTVDGYLFALDDRNGEVLWHLSTGGTAHAAPMTYSVDGRQFISVAVQNSLLTFALPE